MITFSLFDSSIDPRHRPVEDNTNFVVSCGLNVAYPHNINEAVKMAAAFEIAFPYLQTVVQVRDWELLKEQPRVSCQSSAMTRTSSEN